MDQVPDAWCDADDCNNNLLASILKAKKRACDVKSLSSTNAGANTNTASMRPLSILPPSATGASGGSSGGGNRRRDRAGGQSGRDYSFTFGAPGGGDGGDNDNDGGDDHNSRMGGNDDLRRNSD